MIFTGGAAIDCGPLVTHGLQRGIRVQVGGTHTPIDRVRDVVLLTPPMLAMG